MAQYNFIYKFSSIQFSNFIYEFYSYCFLFTLVFFFFFACWDGGLFFNWWTRVVGHIDGVGVLRNIDKFLPNQVLCFKVLFFEGMAFTQISLAAYGCV